MRRISGRISERETRENRERKREPYISTSRIEVAVVRTSLEYSRLTSAARPPSLPPKTVETCELKVPHAACKFAGSKFGVFSSATAPGPD